MIWTAGVFAVAYQFLTFVPALALVVVMPAMPIIYVMGFAVLATGLLLVFILERKGVARTVIVPGDVSTVMAGVTVVTVIAAFFFAALVTGLLADLFGSQGLEVSEGFESMIGESSAIGLVLAVVLIGPVVEELIYRGLLMGVLLARGWTPVAAIAMSAAVFAAQHIQYGWIGMVTVGIYGLALGALRIAGGGLFAPVLAHILINATATAFQGG
jgi:membrane protease YdiL (CAAX protease family)